MSSKFFTNEADNTLINKFEGVLRYNQNIVYFDALIGYFKASGYFKLRPFLDHVPNIRILVGINVDKLTANAQNRGLLYFKNSEITREEFLSYTVADIENAGYEKKIEDGIVQLIKDIISKKIKIKAHPNRNLHAKVYIFRPEPFNEHTTATVISGSSNFTDAGIGSSEISNYEFNVHLNDFEDVQFATNEFEKLWTEAVEILPTDVEKIIGRTYLREDLTPFDLYIKLLADYFGDSINYDPDSMGDLPTSFKKLSYQVDAVNEGYNMLLKHNGFILADVVGLGKTVVAAMIAKKFLLRNGRDFTKILVVYPPAVEKNWKNTFKDFKLDSYTKFITNGRLDRILNNDENYWNKEEYDLIIVDEAHKFRNHKTDAFQNLQSICKCSRTNRGMVEGINKKVILVTATPLNNKPDDIYYQIQMFQDARWSTLPVTNLTAFFSPLIEQYKALKRYDELDIQKLREIYSSIRKNVVEPITVRRTRKDLENIAEYREDIAKQGIKFPNVSPPKKIEYVMSNALNILFMKTMFYLAGFSKNELKRKEEEKLAMILNIKIDDVLLYNRYQAIFGLKPELQIKHYENAEIVSKSLAFIMKTQLVKRLESSFYAFKTSLRNFKTATDRMIEMFENDKVFIAPDLDINKMYNKGMSADEIETEIKKISDYHPNNKTFNSSDFKPEFLKGLRHDAELLTELVKLWKNIEEDPKLDIFLKSIETTFRSKEINLSGKLVIFSESKDTIDFLHNSLASKGYKDVLKISSKNRKVSYEDIVSNFDANFPSENDIKKGKSRRDDYNILLTTEVLAEGVNLHRSNVVVHYDTPWNSTRLMQRIGRVNRIGTVADTIHNFVFYPSAQGDSQIKLNRTALMKIQAFHSAFGEDSQVFSEEEILDDIKLFNGNYKEEEDERLKYLHFLRAFKNSNLEEFNRILKIPLKSRVGRSCKNGNNKLSNRTALFLKSKFKQEFYLVDSQDGVREITPLEAFKIFEAESSEMPNNLILEHHHHVNLAVSSFVEVSREEIYRRSDITAAGGVAQRAKNFLMAVAESKVTQGEQKTLSETTVKLIKLIDLGKFVNLASEIDKLKKGKPSLTKAIAEIERIAQKFDIDSVIIKESDSKINETPQLILSESFGD
jgi:superfamily II DNA/RNA helicase